MIEIIKEAGNILKDLPDLAIYILVGILFYKVVIVGSIFGLVKLAINSAKEMYMNPKKEIKTVKYDFDGQVYSHDGALATLKGFLAEIRAFRGDNNLSMSEVQFLREAYHEKMQREKIITSTDMFVYCKKYDPSEKLQ